MCTSFLSDTKGGMWDIIVLIPDHCLSVYFDNVFIIILIILLLILKFSCLRFVIEKTKYKELTNLKIVI